VKPSIRYIVAGYVVLIVAIALSGKASAGTQLDGNGGSSVMAIPVQSVNAT
jgi:hypothetical protein